MNSGNDSKKPNPHALLSPPQNAAPKKSIQYKLVLLGESAVGKSSLALRFVKNQFVEYQESTIGAAFLSKTIEIPNYSVKFEIWDTAGQERYHSLAPMYYRGAAAAVVVYDVTDQKSFEKAKSWIAELRKQTTNGNPNILIALVGNKVDLAQTGRVVETEVATKYAADEKLLFFEASAKVNHNVEAIFKMVAEKLPKTTPKSTLDADTHSRIVDLSPSPMRQKCC